MLYDNPALQREPCVKTRCHACYPLADVKRLMQQMAPFGCYLHINDNITKARYLPLIGFGNAYRHHNKDYFPIIRQIITPEDALTQNKATSAFDSIRRC